MDRRALSAPPEQVAPTLLGALLVSEIGDELVKLRIVEVEAYGGIGADPGSHAYRGQTQRNAVMFGEPGHAYVYFTYGMHWCVNVVCHEPGVAGAILIRAGEVTAGQSVAERRRGGRRGRDLARGPARLAAALGITGAENGIDLLAAGRLRLEVGEVAGDFAIGPRTGVGGAGAATPWRFWFPGDAHVSAYRPAAPQRQT